MELLRSIAELEQSLMHDLRSRQAGIDDRTGKGLATESIVQERLLDNYLPPRFRCVKGAVVEGASPTVQSAAIDRVIYDRSVAAPLVYDANHSILPIEIVGGLVEITMHLDASKLKADIAHLAPVRAMKNRRYWVPSGTNLAVSTEVEMMGPRCFVVGLPANPAWDPRGIACLSLKLQREASPQMHVHALYVIGIGVFETVPTNDENGKPSRKIRAWLGADRLARFADVLRHSMDRWWTLQPGMSADLNAYLAGQPEVFREEDFK